jgi:hypothetical protein
VYFSEEAGMKKEVGRWTFGCWLKKERFHHNCPCVLQCDLGHKQLKAIVNNIFDDNSSGWAATITTLQTVAFL